METIRSEFKNHWFKIAVYIFAAIFLYNVIDDVRAWLRKPNQTVINQTTPAPINFGTSGQQQKPPEVYVNVHPVVQEKVEGKLEPKKNPDDPNIDIKDQEVKWKLRYNGKVFDYIPYTQEQYNFDPKTWTFNYTRTSEMNVNVATPQIAYAIALGWGTNGPAGQLDYRIKKTPFNIWLYGDRRTVAGGLKFVQYKGGNE